jgi:neurofibromin 1
MSSKIYPLLLNSNNFFPGLGYHVDLATRAIFMEVLMKILNQGTEFDTLAETATRDRYEQLANLMATMGEKGELLLAVALANVVPSNEQDDLAQVLVTLFDAVSLLYQFLWNILSQEVKFVIQYTQRPCCGSNI